MAVLRASQLCIFHRCFGSEFVVVQISDPNSFEDLDRYDSMLSYNMPRLVIACNLEIQSIAKSTLRLGMSLPSV